MLNWLKKLFSKPEPVASMPIKEEPKLLEKPCRTCGKPIFYPVRSRRMEIEAFQTEEDATRFATDLAMEALR